MQVLQEQKPVPVTVHLRSTVAIGSCLPRHSCVLHIVQLI